MLKRTCLAMAYVTLLFGFIMASALICVAVSNHQVYMGG